MRLPLRETIMTFCGIAILAGLGTWQIRRMEWKESIIEKLNAGYDRANIEEPLSRAALSELAIEEAPLGYGAVSGHLLRDKAILLGPRIKDGRAGYHLLIPVDLGDQNTIIINAGWVDELWKDDVVSRLSQLPVEDITAAGVIHKPDWSSFASKNSPSNDMWFRADIDQIAREKEIESPYPFILYADKIIPDLHDVTSHEERWLPRNKHLQYALFWYALGIALAGVYGFYVVGENKKKAD